MHNGNFGYKGFVICMVLFCGYMQWSPVVDFDYVWINGHEHCVGATDAHHMDSGLIPTLAQPVGVFLDDFECQPLALPATQSTEGPPPATTLRL